MNTVELFCQTLAGNAAIVTRINNLNDAATAIQTFLKEHHIESPVCLSPAIAQDWPANSDINTITGTTDGSHRLCISRAWAGIADTGTIVMQSGPDNPTRLNFLAEFHAVLLDAKQIVANKAQFWEKMATLEQLPRALNFISGPSRTADIEQTIQLGAHGPRLFWVMVLE